MTRLQFQYALACLMTGSINKAARTLFTSPENLSKTLKALENELGFPIFIRENNGVTPTENGSLFLAHAKKILEEHEHIYNLTPHNRSHNFSCCCTPHPSFLFAFYKLCRKYQNRDTQTFKLQQASFSKCIEQVAKYQYQIAVVFISSKSEALFLRMIDRYNLIPRYLKTLCVNLNLRQGHPLLADYHPGDPFDFNKLHDYPYANYIDIEEDLLHMLPIAYNIPIANPQKKILIDNMDWRTKIVTNTDSFSIGVQGPPEMVETNNWTCIPIPDSFTQVYSLTLSNTPLSNEVKEYLNYLQEELDRCDQSL